MVGAAESGMAVVSAEPVDHWDQRFCSTVSSSVAVMGAGLFCHSRWTRIARLILRILFVIMSGQAVYHSIRSFKRDGFCQRSIRSSTFHLLFVVSNSWLIAHENRLESLVSRLTSVFKTAAPLKRLFLVNMTLTCTAMMLIIVETWNTAYNRYFAVPKDHTILFYVDLLSDIAHNALLEWVPLQTIFYAIIVRLLHVHRVHVMKTLVDDFVYCDWLQRVNAEVITLTSLNQETDALLSILPLSWFASGMASLPSYLVKLYDASDMIESMLSTILYTLPPFAVVLLLSQQDHELKGIIRQITDRLGGALQSPPSASACSTCLTFQRLTSLANERMTGCSFFDVDKSFLLSYDGTILTFAALTATYIK